MRTRVSRQVGVVCACGVLMLATALAAMPQTSPQAPPLFRGGTRVVPVDIRVVDKKGQPVTDLTQADFTILEDGVPQDVRHFFAQGLTAQTPPPNARVLRQAQPSAAMAPQDHRVFLIVFGRGNLTGPAEGVEGVLHLVRDRLLPQDRVAVFAWNRATDFTTDHAKIVQVLERLKRTQLGIDVRLREWQSGLVWLYGNREIPAFLQREIDAAFGAAGDGVRTMHPAVNLQSQAVQDSMQQTAGTLLEPRFGRIANAHPGDLGMSFDEFTKLASSAIDDRGKDDGKIGDVSHDRRGERRPVRCQPVQECLRVRGLYRAGQPFRLPARLLSRQREMGRAFSQHQSHGRAPGPDGALPARVLRSRAVRAVRSARGAVIQPHRVSG